MGEERNHMDSLDGRTGGMKKGSLAQGEEAEKKRRGGKATSKEQEKNRQNSAADGFPENTTDLGSLDSLAKTNLSFTPPENELSGDVNAQENKQGSSFKKKIRELNKQILSLKKQLFTLKKRRKRLRNKRRNKKKKSDRRR
ncbi:hypothetical protein [Lihuaxuella thermophila]|uniref:Uncharacterized protein n=1 Tax=Lihuaxuella thermophila TaxID=1173111 RepID=A0A1H8DZ39_9BACL|nr:hypothetical protein [Lihuaxuella thermophila]SEN11798.1 hypothetical protein SAMN05444955_10621 [Lihuaxuella thermophila]